MKISPDLTRLNPEVPKTLDPVTAKDIDEPMTDRFGVVYTIGPSPLDAKTVWVGTDDGLIHVTRDDGAHWNDVTPPAMTAWSKVSQIEAGHFDVETAYASVDRHRLADDQSLHLSHARRRKDLDRTWRMEFPSGAFVNSVKEDTKQKGLLYAATELRVYVSFDDGDHWQPLQLNMPVTSVRDIIVHGDDLAVATHGRGFWVLDQMTALRQIAAQAARRLNRRSVSVCTRRNVRHSPGQPEWHTIAARRAAGVESAGRRGCLLLVEVRARLRRSNLNLVDASGKVAACVASDTPVKPVDTEAINVQAYWVEPTPPPSAETGMHRIALNVVAPRRFGFGGRRPEAPPVDSCHPAGTKAPEPETPAMPGRGLGGLEPGEYTVKLTADGQVLTQAVKILPDPRTLPKGADASPDDDDDE